MFFDGRIPPIERPPKEKWMLVAAAGFGTVVTLRLLGELVRQTVFVPTLTIMHDLPNVGSKRRDGKRKGRAVVCGGSVAGLMAAAVCSEHFESVLIIEADGSANELAIEIPKEPEVRMMDNGLPTRTSSRKRVMQYSAMHLYQPPVLLGLQRLFPAMQEQLDHFGLASAPLTFSNFEYGGMSCPEVHRPTDMDAPQILPITREAFETLLRRLVVKYKANVTFLTGTVYELERDNHDKRKLSGVKVRTQAGKQSEVADFVVDATGPAQVAYHKWLTNAGFDSLTDTPYEEYNPQCNYAQSTWTIPINILPEIEAILPYGLHLGSVHSSVPDGSKGEQIGQGIILYEKNQLLLLSAGWGITANDLPHTIQEYRASTISIHQVTPAPNWLYKLFDILEAHEEECAPWYTDYTHGTFAFVKYHQVERSRLPNNWIAAGDSIMKLNPIYGQGCTKAMIDAVTLDSLLHRIPSQQDLPPDFVTSYFKKAAGRTEVMWDGNKATDYGWTSTEPAKGETLAVGAFTRNFGKHVTYVCQQNPKLFTMWLHIVFGLAPSTDFFAPSVLIRVAWSWLIS
ncbi:hypothetical protein FRB93_007916 [Tulasnella sp. JGI-2019a]|nr:hypothetical protein FRB93_007916 [Tulasnella sp. JGI-2019a]